MFAYPTAVVGDVCGELLTVMDQRRGARASVHKSGVAAEIISLLEGGGRERGSWRGGSESSQRDEEESSGELHVGKIRESWLDL